MASPREGPGSNGACVSSDGTASRRSRKDRAARDDRRDRFHLGGCATPRHVVQLRLETRAAINAVFDDPMVITNTGGQAGGGATLTSRAVDLIAAYRAAETAARVAAARTLTPYLASHAKASRRARRSGPA